MWLGVFLGDSITDPNFYEGTLNAEWRYENFLFVDFEDYLDDISSTIHRDMWFQQDDASPHNTRNVKVILSDKYAAKWIENGGSIHWPAKSPDISVLSFFVWEFPKEKVYITRPQDLNLNWLDLIIFCYKINIVEGVLEKTGSPSTMFL